MSIAAQEMKDRVNDPFRVLFCVGVGASYFEATKAEREEVLDALRAGFEDLDGRFGITVLGTMDDDRFRLVPSSGWPWTAYILADVPGVDTAISVLNIIRETAIGEGTLSRYIYLEARVGRQLFFGNS